MLNNRQGNNNRRRGRNNNNARPQANNQNRNGDNGNRIDSRARGNAPQLLEKYKTLARDAQMQGDRVLTEYYHQFADHYFRVVAETRTYFEESQPRRYRDDRDENDGDDGQRDSRSKAENETDSDAAAELGFDEGRRQQAYHPQGTQEASASVREDMRDDGRAAPRAPRERGTFEARLNGGRDRPARPPRAEPAPRDYRAEASVDAADNAPPRPLTLDLNALPPAIAPELVTAGDATPALKRRGRPRKTAAVGEAV